MQDSWSEDHKPTRCLQDFYAALGRGNVAAVIVSRLVKDQWLGNENTADRLPDQLLYVWHRDLAAN